jgi:hypothetical protein
MHSEITEFANPQASPEAPPISNPMTISKLAQVAAIGGSVYFLLHCVIIVMGPEKQLMAWLYDDAFYYLILAKHFSETHIPSFDGVTLTSGYHPLWMWLCSVVYGIRGQLDLTYVRSCMGMTTAISVGLLVAALRDSLQNRRNGTLWALALATTSYSALNNGLTVMEWPLVLLFWAVLHRFVMYSVAPRRSGPHMTSRLTYATMLLLGLGGTLSRTDFGLIPVCYMAGGLLVAWRFRYWNAARLAGAAVIGSVSGLGLVFLYNHATTGSWLQQSAEVKHQFASLTAPFNPVPALWQFARVLLYLPPLDLSPDQKTVFLRLGVGFLLLICLPLLALLASHRSRLLQQFSRILLSSPAEMFSLTSATFGLLGYLFVYSFNSQATFGWYTATVTGFILVLTARIFSSLSNRVCAVFLIPFMLLNVGAAYHFGGNARAQYQQNIGKSLHRDHPGARMGGGDAGKPSFYNDGTMFNLDGLMNNEVVPYLLAGKVHCYILKRHIEYLSDTGITQPLTDAERAKRNEPKLPWGRYFTPIYGKDPDGNPTSYLKTDFDAIRSSGECVESYLSRTY